jgi:hypothetical protein
VDASAVVLVVLILLFSRANNHTSFFSGADFHFRAGALAGGMVAVYLLIFCSRGFNL